MEINRDHQTLNTYYDDFGGGWRWRGFGALENPRLHPKLIRLARLLSPLRCQDKALVWRGVASGMLSDKSDKNIKNLNRGVQEMFQRFPPDALKND